MAFRMERQARRRRGAASRLALEEVVGQGRSAPTGLCGDRGHIPLALCVKCRQQLNSSHVQSLQRAFPPVASSDFRTARETGMGMRAVSLTVGFWAAAILLGSPDFGSPRGTSVVGCRDQTAWVEGWWLVRIVQIRVQGPRATEGRKVREADPELSQCSRVRLWGPMDCSTPGLPVHHQLLSLLRLMPIKSVMPSNHLILCHPLFLLPSIFPRIRVFSSESVLSIRWTKYWSFSFSISLSTEYSGLICFRIDWFDLLAVQGALKSLLQHTNANYVLNPGPSCRDELLKSNNNLRRKEGREFFKSHFTDG